MLIGFFVKTLLNKTNTIISGKNGSVNKNNKPFFINIFEYSLICVLCGWADTP